MDPLLFFFYDLAQYLWDLLMYFIESLGFYHPNA
jgi:hypothetical protein